MLDIVVVAVVLVALLTVILLFVAGVAVTFLRKRAFRILHIDPLTFLKMDRDGAREYLHEKYNEQISLLRTRLYRFVERQTEIPSDHESYSVREEILNMLQDLETKITCNVKLRNVTIRESHKIGISNLRFRTDSVLVVYEVPADILVELRNLKRLFGFEI